MSMNGEKNQYVESNQDLSFSDDQVVERQDAGVLVSHNNVPEKEKLTKEYKNLVNKTDHEIVQESAETQISGSTLLFSEKNSNSASVNNLSSDEDTVNEKPIYTLKVISENTSQDSEVNPASDMANIFINKQKYTSMWNLIYQHVSSETPINENQGIEGLDEEQSGETNGQNVNSQKPSQKPDLDQSTAVKLVKEAVSSILKSYEQPTYMDRAIENTSFQPQQEVESGENFNEPERKMSKSLSKLKKAIATTRFIKAMERLMKNSPRKSQIQEKVNLRHGSVNGRKKDEEWMLDYALRQVVLKLDLDQQRKVALLVEAFETMQLEKNSTGCFSKGEATDCNELVTRTSDLKEKHLELKKEQSLPTEKVVRKQDDGIELSTRDAFPEKSVEERDQQESSEGDILTKEINKSRIPYPTLQSSEHESKTSVVLEVGERSVGDEPTGNVEVKPEGEMDSILYDKQRYTNMWHLIYQHILSNKESTTQKEEVNDDEEEKGDNLNTCHELNDSISTQSTEPKKSEVDEDNQSSASDQSAAIHLVKEAIHAILQSHEQNLDPRFLEDDERDADNSRELEEQRDKEQEVDMRKLPKSFNKLKRAIVKAKFIKAMEKLRKINPRKPRHLPLEAMSEDERVYLRHLSMKARKNDEEWMLDYALRKVISDLDPDQQRKVTRLVEAFETVNPRKKGIRIVTRAERDVDVHCERKTEKEGILKSKQDSSSDRDEDIPSMHSDKLSMLQTLEPLQENMQENQSINLSSFKMELPHNILDSEDPDMVINHQANSKGTTIGENTPTKREEIHDANPMHKPIQAAKDSQNERSTGITKGLLGDKQKNSSMWLLLSQHVKSVNDGEKLTYEDQSNKDEGSAKMIDDDSADSCVTTEITENDAINMVREAINDILDAPQGLENELSSGNKIDEAPKKSLSRGYSKLRKLIICNKFIKSMEKTRKFYPQNQPNLALNSDSEMGKARLKTTTISERKGMDEWRLNNVLQKAIDGLTPIKQRRVALLIEAFEKVNPNLEQRGEEPHCTETESPVSICLEGDTMERENTETMQNSDSLCSIDQKIEGSTTFCSEVATLRVQQEVHKDETPVLIKETSSQTNSLSYTSERKSTNLWGLILQRVTTDMLEKEEAPKPSIDMVAQDQKMLEREIVDFDSSQPSSKVKSCRDMGVQTPDSFDFEEDEAIKLVEEAVEEMLLVQDQLSDTESVTSSTISEQEVEIPYNGEREESSPKSTKENSPLKSYNTLSKVMMCKRFIKAMDKRRKLKAISTQEVAQAPHSEKGIPSLRQVMTSKKSLDEGMLDNALQTVIGNLAPAKKQRVALLVQAFEAVGSQPEQPRSWRGKVSVS